MTYAIRLRKKNPKGKPGPIVGSLGRYAKQATAKREAQALANKRAFNPAVQLTVERLPTGPVRAGPARSKTAALTRAAAIARATKPKIRVNKGRKRRANARAGSFKTMAEIKAANKRIGGHFFERDTMSFFNSKVEAGPYGGAYFVTSEQHASEPRLFSIRKVDSHGWVLPPSTFPKYTTKAGAVAHAKRLAAGGKSNPRKARRTRKARKARRTR